MAGTIDRATLDRLIAQGRERGELTAGELQAALPVDAMDVDALVLVMLELEAAGVSVEPEAFGPRIEAEGGPVPHLKLPDPGTPHATSRDSGRRAPEVAAVAAPVADPDAADARPDEDRVGRVVLLAGLAVLLILGTVLVLI